VELRQLRYFVAVARERSFTRAARQLGVAQPALSQQIRALEEELGVPLVERTNRTSGLTEAGGELLVRAEQILAAARDATEQMAAHAGLGRGTVRIGCALQTLAEGRLPPLFADFCARHPGIRIVFREAHSAQVLKLLARGAIDLGLVHLGSAGAGPLVGLEQASGDLALVQIRREPLVIIVGPGHRLAGRASVPFEELRDEPFVSFAPGATVRELVAHAAAQRGFVPRIAFSTANLGTVRALVAARLGVALVPASALEAPGPPLHAVRVSVPRLERVVTLARNTARRESAPVMAMRHRLRDALKRPS
jgi:LysR family transcriptional regulator, transcription activator of glutamate synthase operon